MQQKCLKPGQKQASNYASTGYVVVAFRPTHKHLKQVHQIQATGDGIPDQIEQYCCERNGFIFHRPSRTF